MGTDAEVAGVVKVETARADTAGEHARPPLLPPEWVLATAAASLVALAFALSFGGSLQPVDPALDRSGTFTRGGLPIAKFVMTGAGTVTVGLLLVAVVFLPARGGELTAEAKRCLRLAAAGAAVWTAAAAALVVFTVSSLIGEPVTTVLTSDTVFGFVTDLTLGRALGAVVVMAAILAVACRRADRPGGTGYLLALALVTLLPPVFTGHSANMADHLPAVYSLAVHVSAAAAWVGGLLALTALATRLGGLLPVIMPRFSTLALVCFAAVAASGLVSAWLRIGSVTGFTDTRYGVLVLTKTAALLLLGAFGWWHRRYSLPGLADRRRTATFVRVALAELTIMAITMALATGLARTPPPRGHGNIKTPQQWLLGYPLPGPASLRAYALDWRIDPLFLALVAFAAVAYTIGVRRLRRAGGQWPAGRSLAWAAGLAVVLVATCSGLARYSPVLFSANITQHLALSLLAAPLLLAGAPLALLLRAGRSRPAAGLTARAALLGVLRSRLVRALAHPVVAAGTLVLTGYVFYFSPVFEASLRGPSLHSLSMLVFLAAGMLFFRPVVGTGRNPTAASYALPLAALVGHAAFGLAFIESGQVFAAEWYRVLARDWGAGPLRDQQLAGEIVWGAGALSTVVMLLLINRRAARPVPAAPAPEAQARRTPAEPLSAPPPPGGPPFTAAPPLAAEPAPDAFAAPRYGRPGDVLS